MQRFDGGSEGYVAGRVAYWSHKKVVDEIPAIGGEVSSFLEIGAWIGYFFKCDPFGMDEEEFVIYWRMAQYLLKQIKPIAGTTPRIL